MKRNRYYENGDTMETNKAVNVVKHINVRRTKFVEMGSNWLSIFFGFSGIQLIPIFIEWAVYSGHGTGKKSFTIQRGAITTKVSNWLDGADEQEKKHRRENVEKAEGDSKREERKREKREKEREREKRGDKWLSNALAPSL